MVGQLKILFADGPKMVNLEEVGQELKEDATDEILQNCHEISDRLKNALRGKNRYGIIL